jgi:hypothetical protein
MVIDREKWAWAQQEYYKTHGWDDLGFITEDKARELKIEDILPDMESGKTIIRQWLDSDKKAVTPMFVPRGLRK